MLFRSASVKVFLFKNAEQNADIVASQKLVKKLIKHFNTRYNCFLSGLQTDFFFQAEDGIRYWSVTGVQTFALPICRALESGKAGSITVFAFDRGQQLSEHTAPFHALVQVLEGEAQLTIGGRVVRARAGQAVLMPGGVPHAVKATERFKMLLTLIRNA